MADTKTKNKSVFVKKSEYETGEGKRCEIVAVNGMRRSLICNQHNTTPAAIAAEYKNRAALRSIALRHMAEVKEKMQRGDKEAKEAGK